MWVRSSSRRGHRTSMRAVRSRPQVCDQGRKQHVHDAGAGVQVSGESPVLPHSASGTANAADLLEHQGRTFELYGVRVLPRITGHAGDEGAWRTGHVVRTAAWR